MATDLRELLGEFFAEDLADAPVLGSFCWAPVLYAHPEINVIRPISDDPANPDNSKYYVANIRPRDVAAEGKTAAGHRFPDKTLNLGLGEELFVVPGKYRPVTVLFNPRAMIEATTKDGLKSEKEMGLCYGCVPSYTLIDQNGNPRHKVQFIENVRAMKYATCNFLPSHPSFRDRESLLRMDRFCWIPATLLKPIGSKLTAAGVDYVRAWYEWFTGVRNLPEELAAMRLLLLEELDKQREGAAPKSIKAK